MLAAGCAANEPKTDLIHVELVKGACAERRVTIHKDRPASVAQDALVMLTLEVPKEEKDAAFQDGRTSFEAGDENRFAKFTLDMSC